MTNFKYSEFIHLLQTEPMYMFFCASMIVVGALGLAILVYEVFTWFRGRK
ncbi:hypothetical protein [Alteromonas phage XX1924]|nr:hypothetical protein [Alteromonas phage XX1924]